MTERTEPRLPQVRDGDPSVKVKVKSFVS